MPYKYALERHPHGWLLCSAPYQSGVPLNAMSEIQKLFSKNDVISPGIAHHYTQSRQSEGITVVFAIATVANEKEWAAEIEQSLKHHTPEVAWWNGTDTGMSAAAIFCALSDRYPSMQDYARSAVPRDAGDLGRCIRLLNRIPAWRNQLDKVAAKYPTTKWPAFISRWTELETATPQRQNEIINEIHQEPT